MARTTISIPDSLKDRMQSVDIDWSAVAVAAFEQKLGELAAQKAEEAQTDVLEPLRASPLAAEDDAYDKGVQDGRAWATDHALFVDLKSLNEHLEHNDGHLVLSTEAADFSPSECLYDIIFGVEGVDSRSDASDFWEAHGHWEGSRDTIAYLDGFAAGAMAVYKETINEKSLYQHPETTWCPIASDRH